MQIAIVDAFTRQAFTGNSAATALIAGYPDDARLQLIAREMNLAETAFAVPLGANHYRLRWFTPTREVPLCGHATLAMAHDLRERGAIDPQAPVVFETLSGALPVQYDGDDIVMDFPASIPRPDGQALLVRDILDGRPHTYLGSVPMNSTAVLARESDVAQFEPDLARIAQLHAAGFCIPAMADAGRDYDIVARFFAPQSGIPEDPVTGSAYCTLAPYWSQRLGRRTLRARQLSPRSGELTMTDAGGRVLLRGRAVTTMRGALIA